MFSILAPPTVLPKVKIRKFFGGAKFPPFPLIFPLFSIIFQCDHLSLSIDLVYPARMIEILYQSQFPHGGSPRNPPPSIDFLYRLVYILSTSKGRIWWGKGLYRCALSTSFTLTRFSHTIIDPSYHPP